MQSAPLLDCAGCRRSPATLASFQIGRALRNKGLRYVPDPPTVEEIIAVMKAAGESLATQSTLGSGCLESTT